MKPGVIVNGEVEHDCSTSRSVGWFLEGVVGIAWAGKRDLNLTLTGVTDGYEKEECSADYVKNSMIPLLKRFGIGIEEVRGG